MTEPHEDLDERTHMTTDVLFIPGSLRSGSYTTALLRRSEQLVGPTLHTVRYDVVRALPFYDADLDGDAAPPEVRAVRATVERAAALVIATPEYNGSVPGGLKNAIDWLTRPPKAHALIAKPVLIIGASPNSKGASGAVEWLRRTLGFLGALVVGDAITITGVADRLQGPTVDPTVDIELQAGIDALDAAVAGRARSNATAEA